MPRGGPCKPGWLLPPAPGGCTQPGQFLGLLPKARAWAVGPPVPQCPNAPNGSLLPRRAREREERAREKQLQVCSSGERLRAPSEGGSWGARAEEGGELGALGGEGGSKRRRRRSRSRSARPPRYLFSPTTLATRGEQRRFLGLWRESRASGEHKRRRRWWRKRKKRRPGDHTGEPPRLVLPASHPQITDPSSFAYLHPLHAIPHFSNH